MLSEEFQKAKQEVGEVEFNRHYRTVFGKPVLDYVKTIVFNLPGPCYCNCSYCLDKEIIPETPLNNSAWLEVAVKVLKEFPDTEYVTITGGTYPEGYFYLLLDYIKKYLPGAVITWNTNGVGVGDFINVDMYVDYINLHRQSIRDGENHRLFHAPSVKVKSPIPLIYARWLFGYKLTIRTVITEDFDLDEYASLGLPLFLNRQLPAGEVTDDKFNQVLDKLEISDCERRRNNEYLTGEYKGVPVRVGVGDSVYSHVPGREPVFLNVCIVHRSGVVAGTWFEDDKVIYK